MDSGQLRRLFRRRGIPVADVKTPTDDPQSWTVVYAPEATAQQRADGAALLASLTKQTPVIPEEITRFQAKAALLQAGRLAEIQLVIDAEPADSLIRLAWTDATHFTRSSPLLRAFAARARLSDADLDLLFTTAAQIIDP